MDGKPTYEELLDALKELVYLKVLSENLTDPETEDEYFRRKPEAWSRAKWLVERNEQSA